MVLSVVLIFEYLGVVEMEIERLEEESGAVVFDEREVKEVQKTIPEFDVERGGSLGEQACAQGILRVIINSIMVATEGVQAA